MPATAGFRRIAAVFAASAAIAAASCSKPPEAPAATADSYAMRGEIVRLPAAGSREMAIRHEAVPDFRDEGGKVVGMEAMTMPFTLAQGVGVDALAPGDKIAFTLEMRWRNPRELARISRIERLPAGTLLSWEKPLDGPGTSESPAAGSTPQ
jgi:hypothetical protein